MIFLGCLIVAAFWIKFGWFWGLGALVALIMDLCLEPNESKGDKGDIK